MLIKTMLKNFFFTAFSHPRIFLHGVFQGEFIVYKGQNIRGTNIVDLLQYTVLPYNTEIPEPAALNIFLKGLAKLEINKSLIVNNGRVLTMLAHKQSLHDVDTQLV
jgi:hypothetical protein